MGKVVKLVHVSVDNGATKNSNKYYNLTENGDGTWTSEYGRVGCSNPTIDIHPNMSDWDKVYRSKTSPSKHGGPYKEVTHLFLIS